VPGFGIGLRCRYSEFGLPKSTDGLTTIKHSALCCSAALRRTRSPGNAGGGHGRIYGDDGTTTDQHRRTASGTFRNQGSEKESRTTSVTRANGAISKALQRKYISRHVKREVTDGTEHFIRSRRGRRFRCRQGRRGEPPTATAVDPPDRASRHP
jgi:hypothetical protein